MTKIFKNMAPYWYMIVAIVMLLIVQAFGDLSLPQYTSDIIDVGIQNKGVEHILPVKMTEDEYEISQLYMTSKEKKIWKDTYEKKGCFVYNLCGHGLRFACKPDVVHENRHETKCHRIPS